MPYSEGKVYHLSVKNSEKVKQPTVEHVSTVGSACQKNLFDTLAGCKKISDQTV